MLYTMLCCRYPVRAAHNAFMHVWLILYQHLLTLVSGIKLCCALSMTVYLS